MRCLLLAIVAGLAVLSVQIRAEDVAIVDDFEFDDGTIRQMLGDLFEFDESDDLGIDRDARARGDDVTGAEEEKAIAVDPKEQARYNSFIDTFLRRLNSFARSRFDPLSVGLGKKGKSSSKGGKNKKGKNAKSGNKKGNKSGNKKSGKKDKQSDKKKKNRHPKDLDLDDAVHEGEESVVAVEEEAVHEVEKREAEFEVVEIEEEEEEEEADLDEEEDEAEEGSLVRVARDADEEADDSPMEETSRRGEAAKGKKGATNKGGKKERKKNGKKGKGRKKSGRKGGKKGGKKSGKKSGGKKSDKKSKRSAKKVKSAGPRTSRADVSGIATLRRDGDVLVRNNKGGKEMRAKFTMGPVQLKVNRKFGAGKKAISREASAISPELTGKLAIEVAANGKAKMTNFRINRPAIVQVQGTLTKTAQGGKSDNNFMENSIGRFSPIAAKKLKLASREILSAGEPKANADN